MVPTFWFKMQVANLICLISLVFYPLYISYIPYDFRFLLILSFMTISKSSMTFFALFIIYLKEISLDHSKEDFVFSTSTCF